MVRGKETVPGKLEQALKVSESEVSGSRPEDISTEDVAMTAELSNDESPQLLPPEETVDEAFGAGYTAWQNGKKITATWCNNDNRNSWVNIPGLGWKKLADGSDTTVVALTMLAAHAKQLNRNVNAYVGDDNKISQMYVF